MEGISEQFMEEQIQKRYYYQYVGRLADLCYSEVVRSNEIIGKGHIPHFITCINKLHAAAGLMQQISQEL
jgi:hypothetical protein